MDSWQYQSARDLGMPRRQRLRSVRRESGLVARIGHRLWWRFISTYLRFRQHLTVEGREHLPAAPPFILAANHSSHFDALLLACVLPAALRHCLPHRRRRHVL